MAEKKFYIEYPKSQSDSNYEEFEYLIRWMGRDGSDYLYMFYDAEISLKVNGSVINRRDDDNIQSLVDRVANEIMLTANDLSKNDLLVIGQILEQKYVTRILKDGTTERYAPDGGSFRYRLLDGRYNIIFKLIKVDTKSWK